jgi:putative aldouronate transport system substrate-binding protein
LNMPIPDRMTFFEIEPFLTAAHQAFIDGNPHANVQWPLMLERGFGSTLSHFDIFSHGAMIGIPYSAVGTPEEDTVVFFLEHPDAIERWRAVRRWFEAGYVNPDAVTIEPGAMPQNRPVWAGQGFYGADAIWSAGNDIVVISQFDGPHLSTASIRGALNAINANTPHVDLSIRLHELINTDQLYRDTLRYGVLDVHWNITDDNLAQRTPEGVTGYSVWAFSQGSYSLSRPEYVPGVSVNPNMWDVIFAGYDYAVATRSIGFTFDPLTVEAQLAAVTSVRERHWPVLSTGTLDTDEVLETMIREMEAAGIRDIIAEAQRQYDAFLAALD